MLPINSGAKRARAYRNPPSRAFRNDFLSLLVHAFSKIRDTRDDLNRTMERDRGDLLEVAE
jgi:hypothetical protein